MARQTGLFKMEGAIGDTIFYKTKQGYYARKKSTLEKDRFNSDPAFQHSRECSSEFGRASQAGHLLRDALQPLLQHASDDRMYQRLTREMMKVVRADTINPPGQRNAEDGDPALLPGFEFNSAAPLAEILQKPHQVTIDRQTGEAAVSIAGFIPRTDVKSAGGATHLKLVMAVTEISFTIRSFRTSTSESAFISTGRQTPKAVRLAAAFTRETTLPVFLALGIRYSLRTGSTLSPLNDEAYNPLALIAVSKPQAP